LRNPLGAVLNAAQLLARGVPNEQASGAAQIILRQARQMANLLNDLLDVSRVVRGKIELRRKVVDLRELVDDAIEAVRPYLTERKHQLEVNLPDEPLWVDGDPARLLQVQENLLMNAAKYTPPEGKIEIAMAREGDEAILSVRDNGAGIAPDMLHRIFDFFVQGDKSLARTEGGLGIGLGLVRQLVEHHGGRVTVESAGENQGSTFTVNLPLTEKRPEPVRNDADLPATDQRIVVVEDNDDSRAMLERLLKLDGYQVVTAADGRAGLEAVLRERPDIVLMDIGLPEMDGYEVARRIRAELKDSRVRLVALTGYGREEDRAAVKKAGFDQHLVKPVDPRELARALR
jgi:CheY-like chemotaxis protein